MYFLPQMSGYIKYFENAIKNMCVIKNKLNIKFHSELVYENKYLKAKVREFNGIIKTNFLNNGVPKENIHYSCIACITIDFVINFNKKIHPEVYL